MVDHLPSVEEALDSIPNTRKQNVGAVMFLAHLLLGQEPPATH